MNVLRGGTIVNKKGVAKDSFDSTANLKKRTQYIISKCKGD